MDMTVTRSSGAITIESEWFVTDTGTMTGEEFTARKSRPLEGKWTQRLQRGTTIFQQPGVSTLSGRFASDDQTLSGTESNVYPLNTGETVTYNWNWQATQRNLTGPPRWGAAAGRLSGMLAAGLRGVEHGGLPGDVGANQLGVLRRHVFSKTWHAQLRQVPVDHHSSPGDGVLETR